MNPQYSYMTEVFSCVSLTVLRLVLTFNIDIQILMQADYADMHVPHTSGIMSYQIMNKLTVLYLFYSQRKFLYNAYLVI